MSVLVFAEHENAEINKASLSAVSAASQLSGEVTVLVVGSDSKQVAESLVKSQGVSKVLYCESEQYDNCLAEEVSALIVKLAQNNSYSHILAVATTVGKNILPRVGSLLDSQPISEVIEVVSDDTFVHPIYAGNCLETVQSSDALKVMTVSTNSVRPFAQRRWDCFG